MVRRFTTVVRKSHVSSRAVLPVFIASGVQNLVQSAPENEAESVKIEDESVTKVEESLDTILKRKENEDDYLLHLGARRYAPKDVDIVTLDHVKDTNDKYMADLKEDWTDGTSRLTGHAAAAAALVAATRDEYNKWWNEYQTTKGWFHSQASLQDAPESELIAREFIKSNPDLCNLQPVLPPDMTKLQSLASSLLKKAEVKVQEPLSASKILHLTQVEAGTVRARQLRKVALEQYRTEANDVRDADRSAIFTALKTYDPIPTAAELEGSILYCDSVDDEDENDFYTA